MLFDVNVKPKVFCLNKGFGAKTGKSGELLATWDVDAMLLSNMTQSKTLASCVLLADLRLE